MGEIADDMIDGTACQLCGQYFEDPKEPDFMYTHGYPVVCKECWTELTKEEKSFYTKAKVNTI